LNPAGSWREPIEVINENGRSDLVLLCEHASNYVPETYGGLGLSDADLARHIAWDIGAATLTRALSHALDAPAFLGTYSRLLIDLNRPLHVESSSAVISEDTEIPGNRALGDQERQRRAAMIFHPFHDHVGHHLATRLAAGHPVRLLSIHSFTKVFRGHERPWHAGVLFDQAHAAKFATQVLNRLAADPALIVDANVPYQVSREDDYGLYVHGGDLGVAAILVEIRQDLLEDETGIADWTRRLCHAVGGP
jgi:predicted N-formylglutamate amidohydrolase